MDFAQVMGLRMVKPTYEGVDALPPALVARRRAEAAGLVAKARPKYSPAQLETMARQGTACRCAGGIVPLADAADVQAAIAQAKITFGRPGDDPRLRAMIARRARAVGLGYLIPPAWDAATSGQGTQGRGQTVQGAPGAGTSGGMGKTAGLLAKAAEYERMAAVMSNPADAAGYARDAAKLRKKLAKKASKRAAKKARKAAA